VLQRVVMCRSVLQRVAACCSVLETKCTVSVGLVDFVAAQSKYLCCSVLQRVAVSQKQSVRFQRVFVDVVIAVRIGVLQCVVACCNVLQCIAVCGSILQCANVLLCATVCYSVWQ